MRYFTSAFILLALPVISACAPVPTDSLSTVLTQKELTFRTRQGLPVYEGDDPNAAFKYRLLPGELEFESPRVGQEIPLNTAIIMPPIGDGDEALLTIEFRRSDFREPLIRGFFFAEDADLVKRHALGREGMETVLTDERVIITIHAGVRLHLKSEAITFPVYKTFKNEDAAGRITAVQGKVLVSSDPQWIKIKLNDFYYGIVLTPDKSRQTFEKQPDGSTLITTPRDAHQSPLRYPPRVIPGP